MCLLCRGTLQYCPGRSGIRWWGVEYFKRGAELSAQIVEVVSSCSTKPWKRSSTSSPQRRNTMRAASIEACWACSSSAGTTGLIVCYRVVEPGHHLEALIDTASCCST